MDIAAFVGLASSGPVDVPVPIEDPRQFAMVFGNDVALPSLPGATRATTGHLGATARSFFNNGGRRCWIVRVARGATANMFTIPGLSLTTGATTLDAATMTARSEGSWSDRLRVRTNLVARPMVLRRVNPPASPDPDPTVDVDAASAHDLVIGDLIRVTWAEVEPQLYVFVRSIGTAPESPIGTSTRRLSGLSFWLKRNQRRLPPDPATLAGRVTVERLTFDLTVFDEGGTSIWTLPHLGFAPEHPRYVGALPTDAAFYGTAAEAEDAPRTDTAWPDLWREASLPRFPLGATQGEWYLPATMGVLPSTPALPTIPAGAALERDGLAAFTRGLFLDPALETTGVRDIVNTADSIRYGPGASRRLLGIHAVLGVEEVTIVAVPDVAHYEWEKTKLAVAKPPLPSEPLDPPPPGFFDCSLTEPLPTPVLTFVTLSEGSPLSEVKGSFQLRWTPLADAIVEVQHTSEPDWRDATTIALSDDDALTIHDPSVGNHYYRVRYLVGTRPSEWSNGIVVRVDDGIQRWVAIESYDPATLVAVQRALTRMCAAKSDRIALLSLPYHYDEAEAVAHAATLSAEADPQALSYAALWHPWLTGRDADAGELRTLPPDGAMAGVMAMRALARGAWVAPANQTLFRVVALDPTIPAEARQSLQDAAINLVRQEPHGFVCLNADTLSPDDEVRPLNVRRLLILLRRAALRAGNRFTFEPNGERLRRALKRGFEVMLEEMFTRGAFAGRRTSDAFRVSTDDSLNSRASVEAGRFLAEIRVAPSRPLSFLTVRLVQRGDATVAQEVI